MWIAEWLGVPYCVLYAKYRDKEFSFEDAEKDLGISGARLLKVLSELGKRGFLTSRVEKRSRRYVLSDFDSIALGIRSAKELQGLDIVEKLKRAFKDHGKRYLVVGGSAAFLYHAYQFPVRYEIEIFPRDYGFWRHLVPEVELILELSEKGLGERREIDGLFVAPPERVIVEGLIEGGITSTLDVVSLITSEGGLENLDWRRLEKYAVSCGVVNELGAILEALDKELTKEYGKSIIPRKVIDELFTHIKKIGRLREYPKTVLEEDKTYSDIGKKWRLKLRLPSYVVRKPVQDVAPFVLEAI